MGSACPKHVSLQLVSLQPASLRILAIMALSAVPLVQPAPASAQSSVVRVGNLANTSELNRYIRRVRDGCGQEPSISTENRYSEAQAGKVVGQHPPIGTRVGCNGTNITLYVSAGSPPVEFYTPSLVEPLHRASFERQALEACGTGINVSQVYKTSPLPRGQFISQSPQQGLRYRCGASVSVTLSAGPAADDSRPAKAERPRKLPEPEAAAVTPKAAPDAEPVEAPPPAPTLAQPGPQAVQQPVAQPKVAPAAARAETAGPGWIWLALGLLALILAIGLFLLGLSRRRPRPASPRLASAPQSTANGTAPAMTLAIGRPLTAALLGPPIPESGHPAEAQLPPNPIVADLVRPIDAVVDWIAGTSIADASATALGGRRLRTHDRGETLAPLRQSIADGLSQALLFQLAPLVADAMSRARELPLAGQPETPNTPLAPHSVIITIYPDFTVTAGGLPLFRIAPSIELRLGFEAASAVVQGHDLKALHPGPVTASASVKWLGESRPIKLAARHTDWPGPVQLDPPRLLHALMQPSIPQGPAEAAQL